MHKRLVAILLLLFLPLAFANVANAQAKQAKRPNIVWITCEDIGLHLGCYGDSYATTPNLDKFATRSLLYLNCWSNAPVCAPARTTIISGIYPPSTGAQHMRSQTRLPADLHMYVVLLRQLGYYCTNNVKTDYNLLAPKGMWNASSRKAHYKNRQPGQPFFAVFNITVCHESQIRKRPHKLVHDPKKVRVPAYHPDTKEVRRDWAQYYDKITAMDAQVGRLLRELEEAGLMNDTIIFYYSDHGSGMPRNKRECQNTGLHVPMMVYVPERWGNLAPKDYRAGGRTQRLVSFVDLAPTLLSLAGARAPKYYQGHAFMGKYEATPREFLHGFRGRMDERIDMVRAVRDQRYVYVRNYWTHKPHGQHVAYQFQTPTTRVWKELFDQGKLNAAQSIFWEAKRAPEELYDLKNDPDEVNNLAASPKHQEILQRLRKANRDHIFRIRDVGFLPENEIHSRSKGSAPYTIGHDPRKYPLERIFKMADLASSRKPNATEKLREGLRDGDSAVRYWAAMGMLMRGKQEVRESLPHLRKALKDNAASVCIAASEALGLYGEAADVQAVLPVLTRLADPRKNDVHQVVMALNVMDALGDTVAPVLPTLRTWPNNVKRASDPRAAYGVSRLLTRIKTRFKNIDTN